MTMKNAAIAFLMSFSLLGACGDDEPAGGEAGEDQASGDATVLDPQVPPSNAAGMVAWLAAWEKEDWEAEWSCEAMPTAKTDGAAAIHVHNDADGKNRVCSNEQLASAAAGSELPKGAAAVKVVGDKVYVTVKVDADSDEGNGWYWYAPGGSPEGRGLDACTGCHAAAGTDADHPGFGDYVYFRVP